MFSNLRLRISILRGKRPSSPLDLPVLLTNQEMRYLKERGKHIVPDKPVLAPTLFLAGPSKPIQYPESGTFLKSSIVNDGPRCLHCYSDKFYEGPQGGLAINIKCAGGNCGWVYNWLDVLGLVILRKEVPGPFNFQEQEEEI